MSERFHLPKIRQTYAAVPSAPSTPGFGDMELNEQPTPLSTGDGTKAAFLSNERKIGSSLDIGREFWPSSPLPPEVVRENLKLKQRIRIMRICHRIALGALCLTTTALEAQTLHLFFTTRNTIRGGRGPWAKQTSLWPSILLLSTSATTTLIGFMVLFSYVKSIKWANNLATINATLIITVEVGAFITWIVVAVLYRTGKTGRDLWGWACSPLALNLQPNFEGVLNFEGICQRGQTNWGLSTASALTNILRLAVWYFVFQRRKYQKIEKRVLMEEEQRAAALRGRL